MKVSVEMYVQEKGVVNESRGYLRDSDIELEDLLKWTKSQLIIISDQVLEEEQAMGFDKDPIMLVDGRKSKNIMNVSPLGKVEFLARQNLTEIILEAYENLLKRSKVLTGLYKASHYVFLNGMQVATDLRTLTMWLDSNPVFKDNDTVRIVNIQPYGRRLELLGVTAQRTQNRKSDISKKRGSGKPAGTFVKVPNGAYQLTARAMRGKYKNNVSIRFTFLPGSSMGLSGSFKNGRKKSKGRPYLYPTLVFNVSGRGLL